MENKKQLIIIILAVAAGIGATVMTGTYVKNKIQEDTARLDKDYKKQLAQIVSQQQQKSDQQMMALAEEVRKVKAETAAIKAQPVIVQQVAPAEVKPKKSSLALRTPPGKRAVTVMTSSLSAVGGLLNPGDTVDVIAQLNVPSASKDEANKGAKETVTVMVFQNIQVLAINANLDEMGAYEQQQSAGSLRLTLALDPQESGLMKFVEKNGSLELVLRGPNEKNNEMLPPASWKTLADYVLQNNGANLSVPDEESGKSKEKVDVKPVDTEEAKPYIQIFRAGKEL